MSTTVSWPAIGGTTYSIPSTGEVNWPSLSNFLLALGGKAQSIDNTKLAIRSATTSPINISSASDCVVVVSLAAPGASEVLLPAGVPGQVFFVVDGTGDAATNNITITPDAGTINGASNYVLNANHGAILLGYTGAAWQVLAEFSGISSDALPRAKIEAGTPGDVVTNDGTGHLSSESHLNPTRGGLGTDASGFDGVVKASGGTFSAGGIVDSDVAASAGIDASKLGGGTVTSAEFDRLSGVSAPIQTQIDAKVAKNAPITPGTAPKVTYDAKGLVTAGDVLAESDIPSGIDATKIGDGFVNNTKFGFLSGVTASIQSQIDGKEPSITSLPISKGGTGQTTKAAAFDALSPNTAKGDLAVRGTSGNVRLPVGTDGFVLTADSASSSGMKWAFASGGGSGQGRVNYISNPSFETDTAGWAAYADAAASTPVDGTGGSPTVSIVRNTTTPLNGLADGKIVKDAANRQGQGVSYDFVVPPGYRQGRKNEYTFLVDSTDANYAAGDVRVYIYDITNGALIAPNVTDLPKMKGPWTVSWDSTTASQFRAIFHVATTNASAWSVSIDDVIVGPGSGNVSVPAVTDLGSVTVTPDALAFGVVPSSTATALKDATWVKIKGQFFQGTPTANPSKITLPYNIDTSKITASVTTIGRVNFIEPSGTAGIIANYALYYKAGDPANVVRLTNQVVSGVYQDRNANQNAATAGVGYSYDISYPVADWAGSGLNSGPGAQVEYAASTTGTWDAAAAATDTVYGPSGAPISGALAAARAKVCRFRTPIQATDKVWLQYRIAGTNVWIDSFESTYPVAIFPSANFGAYIAAVSGGTDVTVQFYRYAIPGTTYNTLSGALDWNNAVYDAWRVVKARPDSPVGFGLAKAGESGLVSQEQSYVLNLDGTFTAGAVTFTRVGRVVTATITTAPAFSSSSVPTSTSVVPVAFRPANRASVLVDMGSTTLYQMMVDSTGQFLLAFRNYSGSLTPLTSASSGWTISYVAAS